MTGRHAGTKGRGMTTTGGAYTATRGGATITGGGQGTTGCLTTTNGGGGNGIPKEMPIDRPACAGVANVAPIPARQRVIKYFVFIVSNVFGFILTTLDEGAIGRASGTLNSRKRLGPRSFNRFTR